MERDRRSGPNELWRSIVSQRNALALMASTGFTALLGFVFWGIAAHLYSAAQVGSASAALSAMTLLAALAQLNIPRLYPRFLADAGDRARKFVVVGYLACAATGLILALGYVILGLSHQTLGSSKVEAVAFVLAVPLWVVFNIQDSVMVGLRAAPWVPAENLTFGIAKLVLLIPFMTLGAAGIFLGWTVPLSMTVLVINVFIFARLIPKTTATQSTAMSQLPKRREIWSFIASGSVASQVTLASRSLVPLIVVARLGVQAGAYFYVPWLVATTLPVFLWGIPTSFVVDARFEPGGAQALLRRSLWLIAATVVPICAALVLGGPFVLKVLGPHYARDGSTPLRLIALAGLTYVIPLIYETLVWFEGERMWRLAIVEAGNSVMVIVGTLVLLPHLGIVGPAAAVLIAGSVTAVLVIRATIFSARRLMTSNADGHE